jgi:hypothetical protein
MNEIWPRRDVAFARIERGTLRSCMQGVAAKNDASYDLSRARASVTGPTLSQPNRICSGRVNSITARKDAEAQCKCRKHQLSRAPCSAETVRPGLTYVITI